ncbi:MAG: hypothetical protein HYY18_14665 [Planctomycetes bacterium]|nr:hypothetical protein [Planctomycetota bacterium]
MPVALPLVVVLVCLARPAHADEVRLRELIARLDAEDPGEREKAAAELAAAGEDARPLLEEAARSGSPEVRSRAEALLTPLGIRRILDRPSLRALAPAADPATAPLALDRAFEDWVLSGTADASAVEGLMEILRLQPSGWAFEALNWIGAPEGMGELQGGAIWSTDAGDEPEPAQGKLDSAFRNLSGRGKKVEWSEEAADRLRGARIPARNPRRRLDTIREVWAVARVVVVLDGGRNPKIVSDTQAVRAWEEWWNAVRESPARRQALGLDPLQADATTLARLDSRDPGEAAAAVRAFRVVPLALRAAVDEAASRPGAGPALHGLRDRLRMAGKGRVVFSTGRTGETRVWSIGLDGSGRRLLSGDLAVDSSFGFAVPGGGALFVSAAPAGGDFGVWNLDLAGAAAPERVPVERGGYLPSPDGARALLTHATCGADGRLADVGRVIGCRCDQDRSSLTLFDRGSGATEILLKGNLGLAWWSPDGAWIAWTEAGRDTLLFRDVRGAQAVWEVKGLPVTDVLPWSPSGDRAALVFQEGPDKSPQLRILDLARREAAWKFDLPEGAVPAVPVWSPDGKSVALPWTTPGLGAGTFEIGFLDAVSGEVATRSYPTREGGPQHGQPGRWTQDGRALLIPVMDGGSLSCLVAGGDPASDNTLRLFTWIPGTDVGLKAHGPDILAVGLEGEFFRIPSGGPCVEEVLCVIPGR